MSKFHTLIHMTVIGIAAVSMLSSAQISQAAQLPSAPTTSPTIMLSIALSARHFSVGQSPLVFLTVKNLSNEEIAFPKDRVQIDGEKGEPPTTLRQRQLTHRLRSGEQQLMGGGFEPEIEPGGSFTRKYDLSQLYV